MEVIRANPFIKTDTLLTNFLKSTLKPEEWSAVGTKKALERRIQRAKYVGNFLVIIIFAQPVVTRPFCLVKSCTIRRR